jgi:hypothetical protein
METVFGKRVPTAKPESGGGFQEVIRHKARQDAKMASSSPGRQGPP